MPDDTMVGAEDEVFDFSGDGIQKQNVSVEVTGFEIVKTDTGTRHAIEFSVKDENGELLPFPVNVREWVAQDNPVAARIGRGNLKKLAQGLLGKPTYTKDTILGAKGSAELYENKDGFASLRKFKAALDVEALG